MTARTGNRPDGLKSTRPPGALAAAWADAVDETSHTSAAAARDIRDLVDNRRMWKNLAEASKTEADRLSVERDALIAERDALKAANHGLAGDVSAMNKRFAKLENDVREMGAANIKARHELSLSINRERDIKAQAAALAGHAEAMAQGIEHARSRSTAIGMADMARLEVIGSACAAMVAFRGGK